MEEWVNCTLGDLLTFQRGHDLPKSEMQSGEYPVVGSNGIIGFHNEFTTNEPSVTIGRSGNVGNPFIYYGKTWSHNTTLYVKDFKGNDPVFIYYFLKTMDLSNYAGGSAVPTLNRNHIHTLPIRIPLNSQVQKKIGSLLKLFDDKIAENNSINENLAVLLQTVYQERFGDVDKASKQGVLSDICSYSKDRVAVSELDVSTYFSTENMLPGKAGSTEATSLPTMPQTTACHKGDTLISNIRSYFKKIVYCEDECGCSTDVLCFMPNQPQYSAYLFSTLYADKFFAFMVAGAKGTKMPRGDKQQIMTYPIVMPSEVALAEFNTIALPLIKQIYSNRAENKRLSLLRDTLLPKLMSGELDVSDIDL